MCIRNSNCIPFLDEIWFHLRDRFDGDSVNGMQLSLILQNNYRNIYLIPAGVA